ncbi:hypothetical protein ALQ31_100025 [Pseudomonas amygdali pv. morsprunorum]|uniref:Uncharacterized protein n=2 Tax=Pseudomonas syringae group genomosp. 2 TaxID=251698 RepID=A0A0Q0D3D7_PSEA0|nr:hypothetical protein ALO90_100637 [Pseudomonas amygdali pv. aesculi]KPX82618.1 hypothetical protein ALO64_100042 [Pseudomonas meliae]KPZ17174.1 hypothetical protein ALO41_100589 [Pseudomonas amygdali pv. ulmi]RMO23329.1 hypothetical protein ALQ45_100479 [Pseudomonas amygdali pv. morsprunorum]RMP01374.1 hypothetical protein ALQ31_100025 [Pseudomonas amygdali pv. morsprunorum]
MKPRISAWRGVSLIMMGALAFYTVTGIIYSERALAIILFTFAAKRCDVWLRSLASKSAA